MKRVLSALCLLAVASATQAQPAGRSAELVLLYEQLQQLQQEVQSLRGQLETQQHQLRQLQQQRQNDYANLDQRLTALTAPGTPATSPSAPAPVAASGQPSMSASPLVVASETAMADEKHRYDAAVAQVRARQFGEATQAFLALVQDYPEGRLTANAHYWLGELYLLDGQLDEAGRRFTRVVEQYPTHDKVPDALFKRARTHHLQNQADAAKRLLQQVVARYPDSNAAQLARDYLAAHF